MSVAFGMFIFLLAGIANADQTILKAAGCKTEHFLLQDLAKADKAKTGNKTQLGNTGNKKCAA